jgi:hypothetical protein
MRRLCAWWLFAAFLGAACLESCGAMTIETAPPDEPLVAPPARAPRLMRRDGGVEALEAGEMSEDDPS